MKKLFVFVSILLFAFNTVAAPDVSAWKLYEQKHHSINSIVLLFEQYNSCKLSKQRDSVLVQLLNNETDTGFSAKCGIYSAYFASSTCKPSTSSLHAASDWVACSKSSRNSVHISAAYNNLCQLLCSTKEVEAAEVHANDYYKLASANKNKVLIIDALFNLGHCFEQADKKSEALKNYLDAYYFSVEINNSPLTIKSLQKISDFFVSNKLYSKAQKYKKEELAVFLKTSKPIDSLQYYNLLSQLSDNYFDNYQEKEATSYSDRVLAYGLRAQKGELFKRQLSVIRSYYFENDNFAGLINLYSKRFPAQLDSLKANNPVAYYRILSLVFEENHLGTKAELYLDSAENFLSQQENPVYRGNFFNRKGEFYLRQNKPEAAIAVLSRSFRIGLPTNYYPLLKSVTQNLDSAFSLTGNYKEAYYYRGLNLQYTELLHEMVDNDEIVLLELENVEKQKELLQAQHEAQVDRKHYLQYMLIVILIATGFLLLIIFSSIHIHSFLIRSLGYFVFIFFFEFIILLADNKIHHMTHGEPLKIMGLKIILIGILLPIHHWVEHKVVHYLVNHRVLEGLHIGSRIKSTFAGKHKEPDPSPQQMEDSSAEPEMLVLPVEE